MSIHKILAACSLLTVALSGCSGGSSSSSGKKITPTNNPGTALIAIESIGLAGSLNESATVSVNGVSDQDGHVDTTFRVLLNMGSNGLPNDPISGLHASGNLTISATDASGNSGGLEITATIYK